MRLNPFHLLETIRGGRGRALKDNGMQLTQENITGFCEEANSRLSASYADFLQYIGGVSFACPETAPEDSASGQFLEYQLELYKTVSGNPEYSAGVNERNEHLGSIAAIGQTFPYSTGDAGEVYRYFTAVAAIAGKLGCVPGQRVAEFGTGWGHVARFLANFGLDVVAVDIEPDFLNVLPVFAQAGARTVTTLHADFNEAPFDDDSLDAAIFFECFHHCLTHRDLIQSLSKSLKPGGRILFCAEPFYETWPLYDWGLRLDGHSVWAIRSFGWLELGFRRTYMAELLEDCGFSCEWSRVEGIGNYGEFLVAKLEEEQ